MQLTELAQPPLDHRGIGQKPTIDAAVIHREAAFPEHFFQIAEAQRIAQIPGHSLND